MDTTVKAVLIGSGLVVVAGIALICSSYSDLQYYEMGFAKSKTTGSVDTSKVYMSGRRWVGPDKKFKIFDASAHYITLNNIAVFAAASEKDKTPGQSGTSGAALSIEVSVHLTYFLVAEDLKLLHDEYDINYEPLVRSSAQAAIKDTASMFKLEEFYKERERVEEQLLLGIQQRLGGTCCPASCLEFYNVMCNRTCIPRILCAPEDKGLFVEARYLQMTDLDIPREVEQRNLKTLIITEETAKEQFTQRAAVIEKETEQLVEEILNSALEVRANSTAQSQLITAKSQANYQRTLEDARRRGLVTLFNTVGLSDAKYKNSFDYLRSLGNNDNAHLTVDFNQLIRGSNLP